MSEGTKWEVIFDLSSIFFNESLPHESSGRVVWEWEIDGLVKELLEVLVRTIFWLSSASNHGDSSFVIKELCSPLYQCLFDSNRVHWIGSLEFLDFRCSFLLLPLLLAREHFMNFINIDDTWLIVLGNHHTRGH